MRLGQIGFSFWELFFGIFQKVPVPSIDNIFVFIGYVQYKYIFSNNKPVFCCFWQVVIEQTRFVSTVFLCSEFKLETIYSGVNFCRKNVCGNFYLRGTYSCGSLKKPQKLEPAKISCHTVLIKKY